MVHCPISPGLSQQLLPCLINGNTWHVGVCKENYPPRCPLFLPPLACSSQTWRECNTRRHISSVRIMTLLGRPKLSMVSRPKSVPHSTAPRETEGLRDSNSAFCAPAMKVIHMKMTSPAIVRHREHNCGSQIHRRLCCLAVLKDRGSQLRGQRPR